MVFLNWFIIQIFGKTMKNVRKHRNVKLEARRNYLVSEPNYHTTIFFWKSIGNRNGSNIDTQESV